METQTKQELRASIERLEKVWTLKAILEIPHENGIIKFAYPSISPGTYRNAVDEALKRNLMIPTAEETASFRSAFPEIRSYSR